tara:strand:- start:11283 stop:11687 length:405 start_codon:yes stop_codon:yes gene_type:complete
MSESKIHSALVSAYLASGLMPALRTAFEGRDYDPEPGQSWARLTGLPTGRDPLTVGQGTQEWSGIFQIDLFHPKGQGHGSILADADTLLTFFAPHARFEYQGQVVEVRRSERSQIRPEEVWQMVSVSIYCRSMY